MRFHNKRTVAVAAALTLALGGGVAYAYWTTTGTGTASAGVGTDIPLVVTQTGAAVTGLYPGGPAQGVTFTVNNPNAADEAIATAVVAISSITSVGTCTAADFTVVSPLPAAVAQTITGGSTVTINGASIAMNETGVNQNGCKNATVNLSIDVS